MKKIILLLIFIISLKSSAQIDSLAPKKEKRFKVAGNVIRNAFFSVPGDFSEMGHTVTDNWKRTAAYAGGILGLIAVDKYTTGYLHDKIEPAIDYSIPNIEIVKNDIPWISGNNSYITYPIIGLYAGSLLANHEKGQVVAINAFKAMTYSYVISHLFLKTVLARDRPQRNINDDIPAKYPWTKDPWDFGNYHPVYFLSEVDGTAMPSFHATTYFAVAKVFQMEYDNYWIPYGFATAVFLADIKSHNHWVSDLLVAGLVGTIIGKSVVKSSRKQIAKNANTLNKYGYTKFKMERQLVPQISGSSVGLHFVGTF